MSISAEEKVCYLREAAIVLAKEGFQLDEVHTDRLCILLDGSPLCEVTESGGIAYRNEDINEPERIDAKDKVYEIARAIAEYMRQMETAPVLKADGLEDGYKVLADFNGTVLAGVQSKYGVHFVTWDWAYGHTGVCHGHYFMENYAGAKQDFAIRSGLIQKERLFTPEQMTEIYRCCADSVDGDFFELTGEQEKMIRSVQQQIEECVPDLDKRIRQQEEALEQVAQRLHDTLLNCHGYVMVSYNYCPYICELYQEFYIFHVVRPNSMSQTAGSEYEEVIITNYDPRKACWQLSLESLLNCGSEARYELIHESERPIKTTN